jgi:putative membrane protein
MGKSGFGEAKGQQRRYSIMGPGMMGYYDSMHGYGGILAMLFWILLIVGIVFLIVWLVRRTDTGSGSHETALDILKKRYAKGEIDKEQFEKMKKDLVS